MKLLKVLARNFERNTSEVIYINPESIIMMESFTGVLHHMDRITGETFNLNLVDGTRVHTTSVSSPFLVLDTSLALIMEQLNKGYQIFNTVDPENINWVDGKDCDKAELDHLHVKHHVECELRLLAEGERDEARAEVERLRGELDYRNEAPDAAVLRAEGTTLAKMTRDAVGDEPDAHALAVYGYVSKVDQFLTRLRAAPPIVTTATHVQIPRADYERVAHLLDGATPPAVCAVDVEAAAKAIADGFELHQGEGDTRTESLIVAILRKHTRADAVLRYLGAYPTKDKPPMEASE